MFAAKVDVSTADVLRAALLSARSLVMSSGTGSRHMVEVFAKLGVGGYVTGKTKQPPTLAQIANFLGSGEADLGFQQASELLHAKGIQSPGPLPAVLEHDTTCSAAIDAGAVIADAAMACLAALRSLSARAAARASGLEPV